MTWTSQTKTTTVTVFIENILNTIGILELESNGWDAGFYKMPPYQIRDLLGLW